MRMMMKIALVKIEEWELMRTLVEMDSIFNQFTKNIT